MDFDTLSLGPISFGKDVTLVPAPGVQQYTGGVDLRPEQNLIVTIHANLDKDTGLLTWRFTSIDPDTGQFTDDPDAGFLPPNVNAPEGDGSVVFTVQPRQGLATGTQFFNDASIVFNLNAPINTPTWCNALDRAARKARSWLLRPRNRHPPLRCSGQVRTPVPVFRRTGSAYPWTMGHSLPSRLTPSRHPRHSPGRLVRRIAFIAWLEISWATSKSAVHFRCRYLIAMGSIVGDLNSDGAVNCTDLALVRASFGKRTGQPGFDSRADVHADGGVNIRDLTFVSRLLSAGTKCS